MDYDSFLIDAYDNRHSIKGLIKLYDYIIKNKYKFTAAEITYIDFALTTYRGIAIETEIKKINKILETMQYKNEQYDQRIHERRKALTVKNPYAEWIAQGKKTIEVRSKNTTYRGELVICSSQTPTIQEMQSGCMLAFVELYDTKKLTELTREEWDLTCIPKKEQANLTGYAWFLRNPNRIVEYPVKGQLGIWNLVVDKMEFVPYNIAKVSDLDVDVEEVAKYNPKAVKDGCMFIIFTFVVILIIVWLVLWYLWA